MKLPESLQALVDWDGSLEDLTTLAGRLLLEQESWRGQRLRAPTRSLVVNYRLVGLISPAVRKRYQWRHLVQLVVACVLVQAGLSRKSVVQRFQSLSPIEVISLLESPPSSSDDLSHARTPVAVDTHRALAVAHEFVPLLAAGLVEHYRRARVGKPLVHDASLSTWLRGAIARLANLYILHGLAVQADGAHTLVAMSANPLRAREWGLPVFDSSEFRFHGIRLLDSLTRLPTIECIDIARQIASEIDLQEQQAFAQLNATCDQFVSRSTEVYGLLREFITRHPVTTAAELRRFLEAHHLQLAAPFLASCFEAPQPHHLSKGALRPCSHCGAPMTLSVVEDHVSCVVRQCKAYDSPVRRGIARAIEAHDTLVAKPHIQVYWCGPGLDEISLYDAAVAEGLSAVLYPGRDKCDVSLDGDVVGIDAKSHANPFLLADTLNRPLGGLELFAKKIIAVNDQALSRFPEYLDIVRRECRRRDVELVSVSALRRKLKAWT